MQLEGERKQERFKMTRHETQRERVCVCVCVGGGVWRYELKYKYKTPYCIGVNPFFVSLEFGANCIKWK